MRPPVRCARGLMALAILPLAVLGAQQFQFMPLQTRPPQSLLPNTRAVTGIAAADLDGDGRRDYVASETNDGEVFLRTAAGWNAVSIPNALDSQQPLARDFDG